MPLSITTSLPWMYPCLPSPAACAHSYPAIRSHPHLPPLPHGTGRSRIERVSTLSPPSYQHLAPTAFKPNQSDTPTPRACVPWTYVTWLSITGCDQIRPLERTEGEGSERSVVNKRIKIMERGRDVPSYHACTFWSQRKSWLKVHRALPFGILQGSKG